MKNKIIKKNKIYNSKSPLIRLFKTINNEKNEEGKIINIKKRKSVLYPEQHNNLLVKSMNFTNRKRTKRTRKIKRAQRKRKIKRKIHREKRRKK